MFKRKTGGRPRKTREKEPGANEPFLIAETDRLHADMIEPILRESGVPFERRGTLGAAVTLNAGTRFETYRFYVPYGAREKCAAMIAGIVRQSWRRGSKIILK